MVWVPLSSFEITKCQDSKANRALAVPLNLPHDSCVTLGNSLSLSELQFLHGKMNIITFSGERRSDLFKCKMRGTCKTVQDQLLGFWELSLLC